MKGCVHIYCGDGKGKTSAAVGLAVRAAGRNKKVMVARFLKNENSGEVEMLRRLPGVTVLPCERTFGFVFRMNEEEKKEAAAYFSLMFEKVCREAAEKQQDVLILDEIMAACRYGLVQESEVVNFLKNRPLPLEVVLTGRDPSATLIGLADYVSEIQMKKHPFLEGLQAREGIEY